jgi:hypothetical protein
VAERCAVARRGHAGRRHRRLCRPGSIDFSAISRRSSSRSA